MSPVFQHRPSKLFVEKYCLTHKEPGNHNILSLGFPKRTATMIAKTPPPPYYAVIFSSLRTEVDEGYEQVADKMVELAQQQPGYLGHESVRDGLGITVSYWESLEAIRNWKMVGEHLAAQRMGREKWYKSFKTRICLVERDYGNGEQ